MDKKATHKIKWPWFQSMWIPEHVTFWLKKEKKCWSYLILLIKQHSWLFTKKKKGGLQTIWKYGAKTKVRPTNVQWVASLLLLINTNINKFSLFLLDSSEKCLIKQEKTIISKGLLKRIGMEKRMCSFPCYRFHFIFI